VHGRHLLTFGCALLHHACQTRLSTAPPGTAGKIEHVIFSRAPSDAFSGVSISIILTFALSQTLILPRIPIEILRLACHHFEPAAERIAMSSILHGENSTSKAEWYPHPVTRGTWNIYQTCVVGK
jgi:hypothetical protein